MKVLDLFCKAGGASMGYHLAGHEVVGVDLEPQPNYPFEFHQADALTYPLEGFGVIVASPPCQGYSTTQRLAGRDHPKLIGAMRSRLVESGLPYVIENVPGARGELLDPIVLCGSMFGLRTYRHRLFEFGGGLFLEQPPHPPHVAKTTRMGRPVKEGEFMHVVGNFTGVAQAREAMGIDWMSRQELAQAIPPAYTRWIGQRFSTERTY